jgi:signal peptidase I
MSAADFALGAGAIVGSALLVALSVIWLRRRWIAVTVTGVSMEPALHAGDEILARRTRRIAVGQIVVAAAPDPLLGWAEGGGAADTPRRKRTPRRGDGRQWWVKRVAAGPGDPMPGTDGPVPDGHYFLLSDNPVGEDSRRHGPCPAGAILGVLVHKIDE